ncbi:DgyrCDS1453 [Dimorphilus gyrociliatus]|uniref:DgyrCDS1453 n=1 Tax=Dimorphilus gyrociliatus TaxID=2664684 RepID=A0A7I8V7J5_9ANNE|nr:DgyrCDS1453 [Dimorphilus gyrociliatus]
MKYFQTPPLNPSFPPSIIGYRYQSPCYKNCELCIFIRDIPLINLNGEFRYFTTILETPHQPYKSIEDSSRKHCFAIQTENVYNLTLSATNEEGSSPDYTAILPKPSELGRDLNGLYGERQNPSSDVIKFSWNTENSEERDMNVTLLYCLSTSCSEGSIIEHTEFVKSGDNSFNLTLSRNLMYKYALKYSFGSLESGISDWICIFTEGRVPDIPEITLIDKTSSSLTFKLNRECKENYGFVNEVMFEYRSKNDGETWKNETFQSYSNNDVFKLEDLDSHVEYEIVVTAITKKKLQTKSSIVYKEVTNENIPETPPTNITALNLTSTSVIIDFSETEYPNGRIISHEISLAKKNKNDNEWSKIKVFRYNLNDSYILDELEGYTNYSVKVRSINAKGESPWSKTFYFFTAMRAAEQLSHGQVTLEDDNDDSSIAVVKWQEPSIKNGIIFYYNVTLRGKDFNLTDQVTNRVSSIALDCTKKLVNVKAYITTVNRDLNGVEYVSKESQPSNSSDFCIPDTSKILLIIFLVCGIVAVILLIIGVSCFRKYFKKWFRPFKYEEKTPPAAELQVIEKHYEECSKTTISDDNDKINTDQTRSNNEQSFVLLDSIVEKASILHSYQTDCK